MDIIFKNAVFLLQILKTAGAKFRRGARPCNPPLSYNEMSPSLTKMPIALYIIYVNISYILMNILL